MSERIEIEGDLIRFGGRIVARVVPGLNLGTIREFEEWLSTGHPAKIADIETEARERAEARHEKQPTPSEIRSKVFEAIDPIFQHNVGLITRDELKNAFEGAVDELSEPV